jgi:predicted DNA-binding transcriptional regulator YafY
MSRNDQVIRQWYLLKRIENQRGATLLELERSLPEDYRSHQRTIRRDLQALEVRFPLIMERASGQVRWRPMDGFRNVPALAVSPTELMALIFSREMLKPMKGTEIKASLDSVFNKAAASLPAEGVSYVRELQGYFSVGVGSHKSYGEHTGTIEHVSRAIRMKRTIQMRYYSASRNKTTRREVDPYRLWYTTGALYLVGHCHLRRDVRVFAVDRIRALAMTNHPYQMPLGFDLEAYVQDALVVMRGKPITVELLFDKKTAAWVKDRQWHPSQKLAPVKGGALRMTLQVAETRELLGWILSFGAGVRVFAPESLNETVRKEAQKILQSW